MDQAVNEFEQEKKKIELALEMTGGDLEKAKKLVSGEIKDIAVLKGRFLEDDVSLFGAFIVFLNMETGALERVHSIITFDKELAKLTPYQKWPEFEAQIIDFQWKGKHLTSQTQDFKTNLENNYAFESQNTILEALKVNNEKKITEVIKKVLFTTLNLETVKLEMGIEYINQFMMKYEGKEVIEEGKKEKAEEGTEQKKDEYLKEGEALLDGVLVISPSKGINITQIQPGMAILVRLSDKTPQDKYFISMMNARDGKKIIPLTATVRHVNYDETYGYLVIGEIGPGVVVKCIEEAQINIKTPEIAQKEEKSKSLLRIIIVIGSVLLFFLGVYIFLSLKGII